MADCGAAGTTLDQATRAILGGGRGSTLNLNAQKQVESLLGHTALAVGVNGNSMIPHAAPEFVAMGNHNNIGGQDTLLMAATNNTPMNNRTANNHYNNNTGVQHPSHQAQQYHHHHHHQQQQQQQQHLHSTNNHIQHNAMQHMQMQHHQQQQAMAMATQQQVHQHQLFMHQQQQQQQQRQMMEAQRVQQAQTAAAKQAAADTQEAADVVEEVDDDNYQDEGNVQGVSMDELAGAWAEAQAQDIDFDFNTDPTVEGATIEDLAKAWQDAQERDFEAEVSGIDPSFQSYDPDGEAEEGQMHTLPYQFVTKRSNEMPPGTTKFMEEGLQHFKDGNVKEAIRNFEMELQVNDPDSSSAWLLLGRCHAENDQDREAIVCLETAVEKDPYSSEALMALGVSCVNELNHVKALAALKSWVQNNPDYANLDLNSAGEDLYGEVDGREDNAEAEMQDLLLKALAHDPNPAVWEALGVASNVSRDFDTAIEAFEKAIEASPQDYQLWNKLGATLANSNQSAKALNAYQKAISLRPRYARAWLNMAISHSNLQDYDEAARCYLQTLSLNPAAVHCWSYLRVALTCAERWDLIPFAASQNLDEFKGAFDFVTY